jgi:hypothetical protein
MRQTPPRVWVFATLCIITVGIISRLVQTGFVLFDKYLGDALYAMMVYALLRLRTGPRSAALGASLLMTALECFQLTSIPAQMLGSAQLPIRLCARLLGTHFAWPDLLAYAIGISGIHYVDSRQSH